MKITLRNVIIALTTVLSIGCAYFNPNNVEKRITDGFREANEQMAKNYAASKTDLNNNYERAIKNTVDSLTKKKLNHYYSVLTKTCNYTDSIRTELNKIGVTDDKNAQKIEKSFLLNGTADSCLKRMKLTCELAKEVSLTKKQKLESIKSETNIFSESSLTATRKEYFEQDPGGCPLALYGLEMEMLKIGISNFKDY